jgi:hypothetical protein
MAQDHILDPAMHCAYNDYVGMEFQAKRLIEEGIYKNTAQFTTPKVPVLDFTKAYSDLSSFNALSKKDKSYTGKRNSAGALMFKYLNKNLLYAKDVCNHDGDLIDLSGFDRNYLPEKASPPEAPLIKKVEKGKEAGTYKAFLQRKSKKTLSGDAQKSRRKNTKYTIEISLTPDDPKSWRTIESGLASTKLLFTDVVEGQKNHIRIYGTNSAGRGQNSAPYPFTPEIQ